MARRKVVIDTDPGVDDAMALMMALEAHEKGQIEILAFTLTEGNTEMDYVVKNMAAIMSFYPELQHVTTQSS